MGNIPLKTITYGWLACTISYFIAEEGRTKVTQLQKIQNQILHDTIDYIFLFVMLWFTTHNLLVSVSSTIDLHVTKRLDLAILFPDSHSTSFPINFFSTSNPERIIYFSLLYRNMQQTVKYQVWEGKFPQKYNKLVWCSEHFSLQSYWRLHQDFFSTFQLLCRISSCTNDRILVKCYLTRTYCTAQANSYLLYLHL